jgi:hypothetical protein
MKTLFAERKVAHLTATIELHFMDFQGVLLKYKITQDDSYNMDETGFRIGCLGSQIMIRHLNTKAVYLSDLDNREMVSAVECISGSRFAIKLIIILAVIASKLEGNRRDCNTVGKQRSTR